jgi:phenylpropionate dioxygenase-like ring-hydroxylating dioxygenase large terminal subunit
MNPATEKQILERIDAVRSAGQVHVETELGTRPLASGVYTDRERYEAEMERIFFRSWIPVGRTTELGEPGAWIRRRIERVAVAVTRSPSGELEAYRTGAASDAVVTADAALRAGVAAAWGFVWVNLDNNRPSLDAFLGPELFDEFENIALDRLELKGRVQKDGPFDWKVLAENYTEPFHVPMVHPRSIHPLIQTRETVLSWRGDHSLAIIPLRTPSLYEERIGNTPFAPMLPGLNQLQRTATSVYNIWPTFVVNFLPNHVVIFHAMPIGFERTRVTLDVFGAPDSDDSAAKYFTRVCAAYGPFVDEDFVVCTAVQRGLAGPFRPPIVLSQYEHRVRHHRSRVEAWLARP